MYRVGSWRQLVLETTCSDPSKHAQCNRNAYALSHTNFAAIVGAEQLVAMIARDGHGLLLILLWLRTLNSEVKEITMMALFQFYRMAAFVFSD